MKTQNKVQNTETASNSGRVFQYAKRVALSAPGKFLLAAAVMISLVSIPLLTRADDPNEHGRHEKRTLTGNWMVTGTRVNPPPGLAPTFLSLMTHFADGNFLEESNTTSIRSTHRGSWERIGHRQFTRVSIAFRFDAARTYLGTSRIAATVALSEDGSEYATAVAVDGNGNVVVTGYSNNGTNNDCYTAKYTASAFKA